MHRITKDDYIEGSVAESLLMVRIKKEVVAYLRERYRIVAKADPHGWNVMSLADILDLATEWRDSYPLEDEIRFVTKYKGLAPVVSLGHNLALAKDTRPSAAEFEQAARRLNAAYMEAATLGKE